MQVVNELSTKHVSSTVCTVISPADPASILYIHLRYADRTVGRKNHMCCDTLSPLPASKREISVEKIIVGASGEGGGRRWWARERETQQWLKPWRQTDPGADKVQRATCVTLGSREPNCGRLFICFLSYLESGFGGSILLIIKGGNEDSSSRQLQRQQKSTGE